MTRIARSVLALTSGSLALIATGGGAAAQGGQLFSPKGLATTEGQFFAHRLGAWPDMRYQMIDGENRKAVSIKEIALRLDYRSHTGGFDGDRSFVRRPHHQDG